MKTLHVHIMYTAYGIHLLGGFVWLKCYSYFSLRTGPYISLLLIYNMYVQSVYSAQCVHTCNVVYYNNIIMLIHELLVAT